MKRADEIFWQEVRREAEAGNQVTVTTSYRTQHEWDIDNETGREACLNCGALRGRAPDGETCR